MGSQRFSLLVTSKGFNFFVATIPGKKRCEGVRIQDGSGHRLAEIYCPKGRDQFHLAAMVVGLLSVYGTIYPIDQEKLAAQLEDKGGLWGVYQKSKGRPECLIAGDFVNEAHATRWLMDTYPEHGGMYVRQM